MQGSIVSLIAIALFGSLLLAQPLAIYTEISPPYQILDADGHLTGSSTEVLRELQKRLGNRDPIDVVPWVRGYRLALEQPNVLLFSMARTKERENLFHWVGPLQETVYSFYVRADSPLVIQSLADARKLKLIGVYREDVWDQYLSKQGFTNLDRSLDNQIILKKLMNGRIEAMVSTAVSIGDLTKAAGFRREDVREAFPFLKVQLYFAFSKATPAATIQAWDRALRAMKQDGTFERILRQQAAKAPLPGPALKP